MRWNSLILIGLVAVTSACSDDRPLAPVPTAPLRGGDGSPSVVLDCVGTIAAGSHGPSVTCSPATPSGAAAAADAHARDVIARDVIVGRQNVDVTLAFANFAFSNGVFSMNTTVKNLLNQPLGETATGSTSPTGTRVFFVVAPAVTRGSGTVRDSNPDGFTTFTTGLQAYYQYAGPIAPNGTSAAKQWIFVMSAGVTGFTFSVEIDAPLPAEKSIRRWSVLRQGLTSSNLTGVWQHTPSDVYAVGLGGALMQYNGTTWSAVGASLPVANYRAVAGVAGAVSPSLWAVGDNGTVVHDTAGVWSSIRVSSSANLYGVWTAAAGNVYAVGANATILHDVAGIWTAMPVPNGVNGSTNFRAVWGFDASHIWVVGDNGTILFGNGVTWSTQSSGTRQALYGVWGDSATEAFAVGASGTVVHFSRGAWSTQSSGTSNDLAGIGGASPTDIWAVGFAGTTLHYTGSWGTVGPHTGIPLAAVTAGSSNPVWAVGAEGSLVSYNGSVWQVSMQSGLAFNSVWASSATDVWVSSLGTVLHYDGTKWTNAYVSAADTMTGIWGAGPQPQPVFTVGKNGNVAILSSGTWSTQTFPGTNVFAVWGTSSSNVYGGANSGIVGYDNGSRITAFDLPSSANVQSVWGSSASNVLAALSDGTIYQYSGFGPNWNRMTTPGGTGSLAAVFGSSASDLYAAGANGTALHSTGGAWTNQSSGTTSTLRGGWAAAPVAPYTADAYAVGDNGVVQHSNGSEWLSMPTPVATTLRGIFGTSSTNIYVVGDDGVVLLGSQ